MKLESVVFLVMIAIVALLIWDDYNLRNQIENGRMDTVMTTRTVTLEPAPIDIDTIPAVLSLKKQLQNSRRAIAKIEGALMHVTEMYQQAIEQAKSDSTAISLPTAVLDTVIRRDTTSFYDSLHTEYVFPPVNAFVKTHLGLAPFQKMIQDTSFTKTIVLLPSLWEQVKMAAPYITAGILIREVALLLTGK